MNIFKQLLLLLLLIVQFLCISANSYGGSCNTDSKCDANQKCINQICRCNPDERWFWTGETCAICARQYSVTIDRCYKSFNDLKTWAAARVHCRAQYADLFTWRNNHDEQFIRPIIQSWVPIQFLGSVWAQIANLQSTQTYLAWAGATVTSLDPHTTKWVDPDGMKLDLHSKQWCDPTKDAGYVLSKQPTRASKKGPNDTEVEECVTYNFGDRTTNFLCLADDYCSHKYPFICEMNAASMKLAIATQHGNNNNGTAPVTGGEIDFAKPPPPPTDTGTDTDNNGSPSPLEQKSGMLSKTNIMIFAGVGAVLIVGAIAGYIVIQKKKAASGDYTGGHGGVSQGRPSFASSVGSVVEE